MARPKLEASATSAHSGVLARAPMSLRWRPFFTTASDRDLDELLDRYDQWTVRDFDADGRYLGTISHVLRVYLIDTDRRVRNIYSVSFLHRDTVINDIVSVIAAESVAQP